jgi:hypothetical protein
MPSVVTANDTIICSHGGTVVLTPKQTVVLAQGGAVLRETDLIGAPIVGCAQPPTISSKPCTTVISTLPGSTAPTVMVEGLPAHVTTLSGITDGVPPGTISVVAPGAPLVQAS